MKAIKTISILSVFILLTSATMFLGCESEESINNKDYEMYDNIGVEHNKGLDHIFEYLKKENSSSKLKSRTSLVELVDDATLNFLQEKMAYSEEAKEVAIANFKANTKKDKLKSANLLDDEKVRSSLSSEQAINFFDEILDALDNLDTNEMDNTIHQLESLQKNIFNKCEDDELAILMSFCVTAKYSLIYWENNLEKWHNEFGSDNETVKLKRGWGWFKNTIKGMAKADALGAGVGATVGLVGFVAGPAGLISVPATAVGYGMNASAMKGLWEVFHS